MNNPEEKVCMVCGNPLPPRRQRYCSDQCRDKRWMDYWSKKVEEGKKTSGYRPMVWGSIRDEKLAGIPYCERCRRTKEPDESLEVHHRVPLAVGGTNELSNLIVLCNKCHRAEHKGKPRGGKMNSVQGMLIPI
ncbi:MAG: HNH endonuclease [Thermoplasmata archaeon]|nr:HNH endonuclease [Thermoplasmata archaeon]